MRRVFLSLILIAICFSIGYGKGWRGITPLRSTCADVKHALNVSQCTIPTSEYSLAEFRVTIFFSDHDACSNDSKGWDVPKGTVTSIVVSPKKEATASDFGIDTSNFTKLKPGDVVGAEAFEDCGEGVEIHLFKGMVDYIVFYPPKSDEVRRCRARLNQNGSAKSSAVTRSLAISLLN